MFMGAGPGPLGPSRNDEDHFRQRAWDVTHYVYLLASRRHGTLYLGVTNDLVRRVAEHKAKAVPGFTAKLGPVTRVMRHVLAVCRSRRHARTRPPLRDPRYTARRRSRRARSWRSSAAEPE
jgi:predicted GIY-YIG superfamily endonuclease